MDDVLYTSCRNKLDNSTFVLSVQERDYNVKNSQMLLAVAPAVGIVAFVLTLAISILIGIALYRRRLPSRKYLAVLSRMIIDVVTAAVIIILGLVAEIKSVYLAVTILCLFVCTFGVLQCGLSHILVIVIRQLSHERIALYNEFLIPRRIVYCMSFIWVGSILYAALYAPLFPALFNPLKADDVCGFDACQSPLLIILITMICFMFVSNILFYLNVLYRLVVGIKEEKSRNEMPLSKYKLKKFIAYGGHIALFSVTALPITIGMGFVYSTLEEISELVHPEEQCRVLQYMAAINRLQTICGGVILLWLVRMVFDPIIIFATEYRRIVPWANHTENVHQLDEVHSTFSSSQPCESLKWRRHCPIMEMERTISAWDMKN
uniref:G_PROTEIN_RECEP_F1_2 domain-containing protein n=1 Tax=Panagrellus redivivus TaxID=6233 RepID=A0A7E4W871_PANRE